MMKTNKALNYADKVIKKEIEAPKYVKKQCRIFKKIAEGKDKKYILNEKLLNKICGILMMLVMAKGPKAGERIYDALSGYQWLLITAALCVVHRDDPKRRRYNLIVLEICRKNGKTFTIALLFLLLFYIEPEYSKFYSVAPDGSLARELKDAIEPLIEVNSDVFERNEIIIRRDYIKHEPNNIKYIPLNYSTNRMDAKEPDVFIADEVGALPTNYPIEAMESGQIMVKNRLGFIISTKYPTVDNPLEDEVANAKRILDGLVEDDTVFSLLYEPDTTKKWRTDDKIMLQGNPLAVDDEDLLDWLRKKRADAIGRESKRENFLTKHCNIIYQGKGTETYIDVKKVQKCMVDHIDWTGRNVYIGVDLAISTDNVAVALASLDEDGKILADVIAFIPADRIEEKNKDEKIDYYKFIDAMKCVACGDLVIDYAVVEEFVFSVEDKYGVHVTGLGFDQFNAMSSAQKWDEKYVTCPIRQVPLELHPPTKLLQEKIYSCDFEYERNDLLEINFQNAKCTFDNNMNMMINKKKSRGKVDMVAALIDAVFMLQHGEILQTSGFVSCVI